MAELLTAEQVDAAGLPGWALMLHYGVFGLETRLRTKDFGTGLELVASIGRAAEELGRRADLDLRPARVDVRLPGDGDGSGSSGVTESDLRLARRISELAAGAGAEIECGSLARVELCLDSPDWHQVADFWAGVLNTQVVSGDGWADVGDPDQHLPLVFFQPSGSEEPRQRWHFDVWVDPGQVQPRIDAALAAGGRLVKGTTLADPQGNKVCLCSWRGHAE